jgi:hypothetical protein
MKSDTRLYFDAPTHVRIGNGFRADDNAYVGPSNGSSITEADIMLYVGASDSACFFTQSAPLGPSATILANIDARNGTLWLRDGSCATGRLLGATVILGKSTQVRLQSSPPGLPKPAGAVSSRGATLTTPETEEIPSTYSLEQNYPNPFNPSTIIRYGMPKQSHIRLTIYNSLGQEVVHLLDRDESEGFHEVVWDGKNQHGSSVSAGTYFCRIVAGDFVETRKMLLLK